MPRGVPRLGWSVYLKQWRAAHRALGLCRACSQKSEPDRTTCPRHTAYYRAARKKAA